METTAMLDALQKLRDNYDRPRSHMEIIRDALQHQVASQAGVAMPPILNEGQRKAFVGKLDILKSFLESEDGADAIELLMNTWTKFEESRQAPEDSEEEAEP